MVSSLLIGINGTIRNKNITNKQKTATMMMTMKKQPTREINICICTITIIALSMYATYRKQNRQPQPSIQQQKSEKRKRERRRVTFGSIYVRHYECIVGRDTTNDHGGGVAHPPAPCRCRGWSCYEYDKGRGMSLDKYEQDRSLLKNIRQTRVGETRLHRETSVRLPFLHTIPNIK